MTTTVKPHTTTFTYVATTAWESYDYDYCIPLAGKQAHKVLEAIAYQDDDDNYTLGWAVDAETVRVVMIPEGSFRYQTERYRSGNHSVWFIKG